MDDRVVVRSGSDNHVLFSVFRAYYPETERGVPRYVEHRHADLEVSYIISGSGLYRVDGVDYRFTPGDVFISRSNVPHCISYIDEDSAEQPSLLVLRFDSRFVWSPGGEWFNSKYLKLFTPSNGITPHIPANEPAAAVVSSLLDEISAECIAQDLAYDLIVKAKLMTLLANLVRYYHDELENDVQLPHENHRDKISRSTDYILAHLSEPLSLDILAKEAGMSRSYYCTIFKTLNGISVWDYISNQRIDLAQWKLENTDSSVLEISESCGYNSIANFNRSFRQHTGMTPTEYRSSRRAADKEK